MTNLATHIYEWIFHYNIYTHNWEAVKRDNYHQLFNGGSDVIRSSDINTLITIINRTDGNPDLIKKLLKTN